MKPKGPSDPRHIVAVAASRHLRSDSPNCPVPRLPSSNVSFGPQQSVNLVLLAVQDEFHAPGTKPLHLEDENGPTSSVLHNNLSASSRSLAHEHFPEHPRNTLRGHELVQRLAVCGLCNVRAVEIATRCWCGWLRGCLELRSPSCHLLNEDGVVDMQHKLRYEVLLGTSGSTLQGHQEIILRDTPFGTH